jgi:hypothetical protein
MVQVTTKTIDPSGNGDYLSLAAAQADMSTILTDAYGTTDLRGFAGGSETRLEFVAGTYTFSTQLAINTPTAFFDENNYLVLTAASGAECNGEFKRAGSAIIEWTGASGNMWYIVEQFTRIEDLSIEWSGNNGQIVIDRNGSRISRCILERNNNSTGGAILSPAGTPNATYYPIVIEDTVINLNTPQFVRAVRADDTDIDFANVTYNNMQGTSNLAYCRATTRDTSINFYNCILNHNNRGTMLRFDQNGFVLTLAGNGNIEANHSQALPVSTNQGGVRWTFSTNVSDASTGSQIIWDDATGKMYTDTDASGNDAWQVLTSLVNTNTTDIEGNTRSVSGFNPGAYESGVSVAPPDPVGTADLTVSPELSAAGSTSTGGTSAGSVGAAGLAGQASVILPVTGTMAGTVGGAQMAATGGGPVFATMQAAVSGVLSAAQGGSTITGTMAGIVGGPSMAGSALVNGAFVTDGGTEVAPASIAGSGSQRASGTANLTSSAAVAAATGSQSSTSTGAPTTGSAGLTSAGSQVISASGSLALAAPSLNAQKSAPVGSTAVLLTAATSISAQGTSAVLASGQLSLGPALTSVGSSTLSGSGALVVGSSQATGLGTSLYLGTASLTTGQPGVASSSALAFQVSTELTVGGASFSGDTRMLLPFRGYIALKTGRPATSGNGRLRAAPQGAVMHAGSASCSGQGGMIAFPNHSRGAGIIISG